MKKAVKILVCIVALVLGMQMILSGCLYYAMNCKKTVCDTSVSQDGNYQLVLMAVGEPGFPFGSAPGRLILKEGEHQISQADFKIANDGGQINSSCWAVIWNETYVEVILSGEEQDDELFLLYFDGSIEQQYLREETESATEQAESEIIKLDIDVIKNRENELVFNISIDDYIDCYNQFYMIDQGRSYLAPSVLWQSYPSDCAVHSEHKTYLYCFSEDEQVYSLPTITVYVPANGDYIQEITVNFDEHSYSDSMYELYEQMCYYTLKVFFQDLSDEEIVEIYEEANKLGNLNVFASEEGEGGVPCVLYYKDGIGVYPYFAIGQWMHLCVIPVTQETVTEFAQKGTEIHEIESN